MKLVKLIPLILAVLFMVQAAPLAAETSKTFLLVTPKDGYLRDLGQQARQGAETALKIWGGGFNLEVVEESGEGGEDVNLGQVAAVMGYFSENRFRADAPRYLYLKKPVLLPYLTNRQAAAAGPLTFFSLMPTIADQGRFMAMEILTMKKRPSRILIIVGEEGEQSQLVEALTATLAEPVQEPVPVAEPGKKAPKAPAKIRPLDTRSTKVVTISKSQAMSPDEVTDFGKSNPDLIILAVGIKEAFELAPVLAESKWAKSPMWSGIFLAFRETGAAFASLKLRLNVCLPVPSPLNDDRNRALRDFKSRYVAEWRTQPTWISAMAYDSVNILIKAASAGESPEAFLTYLTTENHHSLGAYELSPGWGEGGAYPLSMMPVRAETLGYLP
ncbi:ABC transporter substrate-binding protein [Deltaproteobacteria bacterium OttesenSCG-928-K17]|nr:ABC transporter substrate-binding protein [Deltaproteobacteria bacterium OttesenSCG-928-K17]